MMVAWVRHPPSFPPTPPPPPPPPGYSPQVFHAEQPSRSKSEVELVGAGGDPVPNQESLSTMWYTAAALPATAGKVTTPIPASAWATPTQFDPTRGEDGRCQEQKKEKKKTVFT